jgi:hypothetical protein
VSEMQDGRMNELRVHIAIGSILTEHPHSHNAIYPRRFCPTS